MILYGQKSPVRLPRFFLISHQFCARTATVTRLNPREVRENKHG